MYAIESLSKESEVQNQTEAAFLMAEKPEYDNIFEAVTDDPAEAAEMQKKADLLLEIYDRMEKEGIVVLNWCRRLRISFYTAVDLLSGKIDKFTLSQLQEYADRLKDV